MIVGECALFASVTQFSLLFINVYLSHEYDGSSIHELGLQLTVIEDIINSNPNCHMICDGD